MIDVLRRPFMLVHAAYGVPPRRLVWRYGLRNGLTSVLTLVGMTYGALIENAFLVEVVFSWPGLSAYGAAAVLAKDFNAVVGRDPRRRALVRPRQRAGRPPLRLCRSPRPLQLSSPGSSPAPGRGGRPGGSAACSAIPCRSAGAAIVLLLVGCALTPGLLAPFPEDAGPSVHFDRATRPPGRVHWFGTDEVGRDIFSRTVYGARVSLTLVVAVLGIALGVGVPLGLVAGYWSGRWASTAIMRVTDVFLAVPPLALALAVTAAFRPDLWSAMLAISFTWWPWYTRLVYGEVLARREEPYVEAARALGERDGVILFREILPNVVSPVVVKATLDVSFVILLGSGLAFLGVGAQEPTPDWGAMVARGRTFLPGHWWMSTMPGLAIFVAVMGFNLLGDALRDALDVWER